MIKVKLLDYTPEPERVVAMAARLCYSASGAEELAERLSEEKVREMVRMARRLSTLPSLSASRVSRAS